MSVEVNLIVFIDIRCIYMLEFVSAGTPKLFVSIDALLEEPRLVPFYGLDVFWWGTSLFGVNEFELLLDLVFVECWSRGLDGSEVPLAAIDRLRLLWSRLL